MIFPNICVWEHHSVVSIFHTKNIVFKEGGPEWFLQERSSRIDQALPSHQCCFWHNHWLVIFTPNFHFLSVKLLTNAGSISLEFQFPTQFLITDTSCTDTTECYDQDVDPNGEKYDGCVNSTVSGRVCKVSNS